MKVMDMHCDTIAEIWYSRLRRDAFLKKQAQGRTLPGEQVPEVYSLRSSPLMIDLGKMRKGGYLCQNFAMFADLHRPAGFEGDDDSKVTVRSDNADSYMDPWDTVNRLIAVYKEEIAQNSDLILPALSAADIESNAAQGKMSAMLTVEEGGVCKGSLDHLRELYADGVRMMTLTWNYRNELGCPNDIPDGCGQVYARYFEFVPRTDNGLTEKGFAFAEAMQSMGMLVDVSHLSDAGFYDIARTVRGPFVASHSNCRALCGCNRDMTDDMIRTVGEHGGVIGLNYCPEFLTAAASRAQCLCSPERLAAHARHMMDVGGREIVGLGSDFDGIGRDGLELNDCSEVGKIEAELEKEHFTQTEIDGIMGQNVMRVYREVLK